VTNNSRFWIGWLDLFCTALQLQSIIAAHNQWLSKTRSIPYWTTTVFSSTVTDLVLIYKLVTSSAFSVPWLSLHSWTVNCLLNSLTDRQIMGHLQRNWTFKIKLKVTLGLTVSQSVSKSWCRAPSGAYDQIFITAWQLWSCFSGVPSLTRGRVCLLYMLLALASAVFLRSESLVSQIWDFPFCRLLRLTGSQWRYLHQSQSHIANDGQSVSKSWCRAPSGAYDQIFITVWQLRSSVRLSLCAYLLPWKCA
jgi:hypothetical protein